MTAKQNAIVGVVHGYDWGALEDFVMTLRATGFNGTVAFLCSGVSTSTRMRLIQEGVEVHVTPYRGVTTINSWNRFWPRLARIRALPGTGFILRSVLKRITNLQTARFWYYADFLRERCHLFDQVLLTDVRDVIFQRDPFCNTYEGVQSFIEGTPSLEIGHTGHTAEWVASAYGRSTLDAYAHRPLLCSGTLLGEVGELLCYLTEFMEAVMDTDDVSLGGIDQGIHNVAWHRSQQMKRRMVHNGAGTVFTAGLVARELIRIDRDGLVVDESGRVIPVLHQLDRHPELYTSVTRAVIRGGPHQRGRAM